MQTMSNMKIEDVEQFAFQGGSVRGIGYLGAWESLLQLGLQPKQIQRVAGTSAGSITALLLALGHNEPLVLLEMLESLNFKEMLDERNAYLETRDKLLKANQLKSSGGKLSSFFAFKTAKTVLPKVAHRLQDGYGIYDGEYLREWFEKIIKERTRIDKLTFQELHALKETRPELSIKDLYVVGVNLSTRVSETFSYEHTPNVVISDAVRISMSIPFIFKPHFVWRKDETGKVIQDSQEHLYVDGGLMDNYPIHLFDHSTAEGGVEINRHTLGFRLLEQEQIDFFEEMSPAPDTEIDSFLSFGKAILSTITSKQNSDHARRPEDKVRSVYIETMGIGTLNFDLSKEQKQALIRSGRLGVIKYFGAPLDLDASPILAKMQSETPQNLPYAANRI